MGNFNIAHVTEQGQTLIIVLVSGTFGELPEAEREAARQKLQRCADEQRLAGTVVCIWDETAEQMGCHAPPLLRQIFRGRRLREFTDKMNALGGKKLPCDV